MCAIVHSMPLQCIVKMLNLKTKGRVRALWVRSPHALMVTGRAISVWSELIAELVRPMADPIAELWPEDGRPSDGSRKMVN